MLGWESSGAKCGTYDCEGAAVQDISTVGNSPRGAEKGKCLLVLALGDGVHLLGVLNRRPLGHKPHTCSHALEVVLLTMESSYHRGTSSCCLLKVPCGLRLWQESLTGHTLLYQTKSSLTNKRSAGNITYPLALSPTTPHRPRHPRHTEVVPLLPSTVYTGDHVTAQ